MGAIIHLHIQSENCGPEKGFCCVVCLLARARVVDHVAEKRVEELLKLLCV